MTLSSPLPFEQQLARLWRELSRAIRLQSPLIVLVTYQSEFVRADAEAELEERLRGVGQLVERVFINAQNPDLPDQLRQRENSDHTVYFISGLRFGGGEDGRSAYRALNIRREYFIKYGLRVVFWLVEEEAHNLPRYAPDFWAFRHRAVEFMEEPTSDQIAHYSAALPQRQWANDWTLLQDNAAKIAYRRRLLQELPDTPESSTTRAEILYALGTLYRASRQFEAGVKALQQALSLAQQIDDAQLQVKCYNELGEIYNDQGQYQEALFPVNQALQISQMQLGPDHPDTAQSLNNLGYLLRAMGNLAEARPYFERALAIREKALGPNHPDTALSLNNLGGLLDSMGNLAEARPYYERALAIKEAKLGTNHPSTKITRDNLAWLNRQAGTGGQSPGDLLAKLKQMLSNSGE